jgi:dienelactone hydrolase
MSCRIVVRVCLLTMLRIGIMSVWPHPAEAVTYHVITGRDTLGTEEVTTSRTAEGRTKYRSKTNITVEYTKIEGIARTFVDSETYSWERFAATGKISGRARETIEFNISAKSVGENVQLKIAQGERNFERQLVVGATSHISQPRVVHHYEILLKRLGVEGWFDEPVDIALDVVRPQLFRTAPFDLDGGIVAGSAALDGKSVTTNRVKLKVSGVTVYLTEHAETHDLLMLYQPANNTMIKREDFELAAGTKLGEDEVDDWVTVLQEKIREEEGNFAGDGCEIGYSLPLPKEKAKSRPGLILIHGSGPNDRDETLGPNKPFRDLAYMLAARGAVVLRYDKRTHACGLEMALDDITFANVVLEDAATAVRLLREHPETDPDRIYVGGHSLGGLASPYVGNATAARGLVVLAGSATSILEAYRDQSLYLMEKQGADQVSIDSRSAELDAELQPLLSREMHPDSLFEGVPVHYWYELEDADPIAEVLAFEGPILVMRGSKDYQVTGADQSLWQEAISRRKNEGDKAVTMPGANHLLTKVDGVSDGTDYLIPGHVDEEFADRIAAFIGLESEEDKANKKGGRRRRRN